MTTQIVPYALLFSLTLLLLVLLVIREKTARRVSSAGLDIGSALAVGRREVQADACLVSASKSGYLLAVFDGMGAERRSAKLSEIVCGAIEEQYSHYGNEHDTDTNLFFKSALSFADRRVKNFLADDGGGVSASVALVINDRLFYAYCGNTLLAVLRKGMFVPLYAGHTVRDFAEKAYLAGEMEREDALLFLSDKRVYRFVGSAEFEPEIGTPVRLEKGDVIVLMTDGVFSSLGKREITDILSGKDDANALAKKLIEACEKADCDDNAAVLIARV
jgi:serine/threonine protein phosphatase PrpC